VIRARALGSATAILLALGGCGSATKTVTQPAVPVETATSATARAQTQDAGMSHADLIAALNELCETGNRKAGKLNGALQTAQDKSDYDTMADVLDQTLPIYDQGAKKLAQLRPSGADQEPFARYVQAFNRQHGIVKRVIDALRSNDTDTASELIDALDAVKRQRLNAALDLGADKCGK
jgi:hypothetical protein